MNINPHDLFIPALVASGALLALVAVLLWTTVAHGRRLAYRLATVDAELERLRAEVASAAGLSARVGERQRRLDARTVQIGERLGQLELRGEGRPYDQAIALVRRGADADRLVNNYGLSRGEADLVALLHGRRKTG